MKLLVVDDEIDVREFARSFFQKRGLEVFIASNGSEALDLIGAERPDLVLLDIRMEGQDGMDVLQELEKKKDRTKVVMVSGMEDGVLVEQAKALGVVQFIHKPLILEELEKVVMAELNETT